MKTHADVIEAMGGIRAVADLTEFPWMTVRNWTRPGRRIPPNVWRFLSESAPGKKLKLTPGVLYDLSETYNR